VSDLKQLKAQVEAVGGDAKSIAAALGSFESKFSESAQRIDALIGGTAQQTDKEMIATLNTASQKVSEAVRALTAAASAASQFAASL